MIRQRENSVVWPAGFLSLLVHGVFFLVLVMTFSWKSVPPMQVAQVELWENLPVANTESKPVPPKPQPVVEPKPVPKVEPKPEPAPEPKAEIQLKPKKPAPEVKPEKLLKKEAPKPDPKVEAKKEEEKKLEALKRAMLAEDDSSHEQAQEAQQIESTRAAQAQQAAANAGALDAAKAKLIAKVRRYVNPQVCGSGKPVVEFNIALMPTGEVIGNPHLQKGSGIPACDQAVERAILQAQPLPIPREPELFSAFRDLNLKFRPNDTN
jgi:colicin import membrane protein